MKQKMLRLKSLLEKFTAVYEAWEKKSLLGHRKRYKKNKMSLAEMLLVVIHFHLSEFRVFKYYYIFGICNVYRDCFLDLLSYNRFVELKHRLILPLSVLLHATKGETTGIYFKEETKLVVCHNKRTNSHQVFKDLAKIGRSSYGWFYGFKMHIILNDKRL